MDGLTAIEALCANLNCAYLENEPMSAHTTFKIGGPARLFARPESAMVAERVLRKAYDYCVPTVVIGKGSNLLVSEEGIDGLVISLDEESGRPALAAETVIRCPAGASLARLCSFAQSKGLSGLEFAWGIPGSVGGAVYMNAGAYGGEIKQVLRAVEYLTPRGEKTQAELEELELGYRSSRFMRHPGCLITDTLFHLKKDDPEAIRERMEKNMNARKSKQPLEYPSAGSTFKRPLGAYASELIEQCGLKGYQIGGAMVSKKHAGFIINYENATSEDVKLLINEVQRVVKLKTGFSLECEVLML